MHLKEFKGQKFDRSNFLNFFASLAHEIAKRLISADKNLLSFNQC